MPNLAQLQLSVKNETDGFSLLWFIVSFLYLQFVDGMLMVFDDFGDKMFVSCVYCFVL